jgi:hypothetical protein
MGSVTHYKKAAFTGPCHYPRNQPNRQCVLHSPANINFRDSRRSFTASHPSYDRKSKEDDGGAGWPGQKVRPHLKTGRANRAGAVTHAEERLPSKWSPNPGATKNHPTNPTEPRQ